MGRRVKREHLANLRSILSYLEIGHWLQQDHADSPPLILQDKTAVFELALSKVVGSKPLYLEFGVFKGESLRWWSEHLPHPDATIVGFDSFQGLPEDWQHDRRTGHFTTDGPPIINDDRISFRVGWFEETLPEFKMPDHDQLIINIDSDLYSSAVTVLTWAEPYLRPGTLVYFDEFPDRDHELRAYNEFVERSPHKFQPLARARIGWQWLFEVTA